MLKHKISMLFILIAIIFINYNNLEYDNYLLFLYYKFIYLALFLFINNKKYNNIDFFIDFLGIFPFFYICYNYNNFDYNSLKYIGYWIIIVLLLDLDFIKNYIRDKI